MPIHINSQILQYRCLLYRMNEMDGKWGTRLCGYDSYGSITGSPDKQAGLQQDIHCSQQDTKHTKPYNWTIYAQQDHHFPILAKASRTGGFCLILYPASNLFFEELLGTSIHWQGHSLQSALFRDQLTDRMRCLQTIKVREQCFSNIIT